MVRGCILDLTGQGTLQRRVFMIIVMKLVFHESRKFLAELGDYLCLKKDSVPCSQSWVKFLIFMSRALIS
jgi:hypothetical protein